MAYTVLARKYRPQKFADLVGQEHVTRTIGNAIASGRVAHAFLFTGARGVGKTSTARLLAKALNCEQGPTAEPCNTCDPCREITQGNDLDVLEIDGASHNSVDDVRKLQEGLPYRPARDRFKVVIVDEVHMLSTGAFNAFLKTLEEPPSHVKFIFATTEVHKVPITIRSRCQRHDFRLIPQSVVIQHVREILAAEGVECDETALHLVAREAAGSMRDALTTLDQVLAFTGDKFTGEAVARGLGIAGREQVFAAARALIEGEPADCLKAVFALGEAGVDVLHFSRQLVEYLRDLVVLQVVGHDGELVELSPDERAAAEDLCAKTDRAELQRAFAGVSALVDTVAQSAHPRMALEMGLVRLADRPRLQPLGELVAKLDGVLSGGPPAPPSGGPGGGGPGGGGGGGPSKSSARVSDPRFQPPPSMRTAEAAAAPARMAGARIPKSIANAAAAAMAASAPEVQDADADPHPGRAQPKAPTQKTPDPRFQPPASVLKAAPEPEESPLPEPPSDMDMAPPLGDLPAPTGRPTPAADRQQSGPAHAPSRAPASAAPAQHTPKEAEGTPMASPAPPAPAPPAPDAQAPAPEWTQIVTRVRERLPALGAILEHGVATTINTDKLIIRFPEGSFFGRQAKTPAATQAVKEAAEHVLGAQPQIEVTFGAVAGHATIAQVETEARSARLAQAKEAALGHPAVLSAIEVFPEAKGSEQVRVEGE